MSFIPLIRVSESVGFKDGFIRSKRTGQFISVSSVFVKDRLAELPTECASIKDKEKGVGPTSIEHFVALLVSSEEILENRSFIFSFFLSSRVFIGSSDLLKLLLEKTIHCISNHKVITKVTWTNRTWSFCVRAQVCEWPAIYRGLCISS